MKKYLNIIVGVFIYTVVSAQTDITIIKKDNIGLLLPQDTTIKSVHDTSIFKKDSINPLFQDTAIKTLPADTLHQDSTAKKHKLKTITGIASFYSKNLHGSKTSTGETYKHEKYTAASNEFKLHTWVRVTNLSNHKSVIVRINDHMHKKMQKKGRVIDLSRSAAQKLDFIKKGLTKVKVEEVIMGTTD